MDRVGFGPRFLAALIDGIAIVIVMWVLGMVLGIGIAGFAPQAGFSILAVIMGALPLAYTSTEIFMAASPGKKAMKLRIKNEDGTDASPAVLQKRWIIKMSGSVIGLIGTITTIAILSTVGSIVGLIIFIGCFMIFAAGNQALHDKIAKTAVFKTV
jgi:uncharacterized RDD family membrane protein YckC